MENLASIPGFDVVSKDANTNRLTLRVARQTIPIHVVSISSGYPRDVRAAVWRSHDALSQTERLLIAAPSLSPGSREWLRHEGIGYADASGHLFFASEGVYVLREDLESAGNTAQKSGARKETDIFRGRATQVLHALLHAPARAWHVTELARDAGVAAGTALRVCETLEKMLLMDREGRGPKSVRMLSAAGKLLNEWAAKHSLENYEISRFYRWQTDMDEMALLIGKAAEEQGLTYATTLGLGAMHRAPFLTHVDQAALLIPAGADIPGIAEAVNMKSVDDGANILLLQAKNNTPFMYRQHSRDLALAGDIQLYLDLHASSGRGKEQAEHLRHERIGF